MQRLQRENAILRQERDILNKAIAIFSQPPKPSTDSCSRRTMNIRIDAEVNQRYGSPHMQAELANRGLVCNRKRVARLMHLHGIRAVHSKRRRRVVTTQSNHNLPVAANVLNREFTATMPQKPDLPLHRGVLQSQTASFVFRLSQSKQLQSHFHDGVNRLSTRSGEDQSPTSTAISATPSPIDLLRDGRAAAHLHA